MNRMDSKVYERMQLERVLFTCMHSAPAIINGFINNIVHGQMDVRAHEIVFVHANNSVYPTDLFLALSLSEPCMQKALNARRQRASRIKVSPNATTAMCVHVSR